MNNICCCENISDFHIKWDAVEACGTVLLAFLTIYLARAAIRQLKDIQTISVENVIMKQIDFHYKIVERIKPFGIDGEEDPFRYMYTLLAGLYFDNNEIDRDDDESIKSNIGIAFNELYRLHGNLLGHYFRNLYRTFKNINETKIEGFNKDHYAKLVRAQLSEYEILLLFYNCIWVGDENKFKKLVEQYELLEGMSYSKLFDVVHGSLYENNAFGDDY